MRKHMFPGSLQSSPKMPPIYISKYNRFIDNIIGRINRILGKSFDPVRVKLQTSTSANINKTKKKTGGSKKKKTGNKRNSVRGTLKHKMSERPIARSAQTEEEPSFILISKNSDIRTKNNVSVETRAKTKKTKTKRKSNKTKASNNKGKSTQKARATLFGLSSIKRDGDVSVNMMSDHTTVKTNFVIGPLTLRVEREIGRGAKRELKSATATTAEMFGRLNLKILHGGAAALQSIRVLQPKQVRVESADDHEKTKEFMWRKSYNIASLVSRKLAVAARSMLKPPQA